MLAPGLFEKKRKKPIARSVATNEKKSPMKMHRERRKNPPRKDELERKEKKNDPMFAYMQIELVTSGGKCRFFVLSHQCA